MMFSAGEPWGYLMGYLGMGWGLHSWFTHGFVASGVLEPGEERGDEGRLQVHVLLASLCFSFLRQSISVTISCIP